MSQELNEEENRYYEQNFYLILKKTAFFKEIDQLINESKLLTRRESFNQNGDKLIYYRNHKKFITRNETKIVKENEYDSSFSISWDENYYPSFKISVIQLNSKNIETPVKQGFWGTLLNPKTETKINTNIEHKICEPFKKLKNDSWSFNLNNFTIFLKSELNNNLLINEDEFQLIVNIRNLIEEKLKHINSEINELDLINQIILEDLKKNELTKFNDSLNSSNSTDIKKLLQIHQNKIIEIDKDFIQKLIRVSNYINKKDSIIQQLINKISNELYNDNQYKHIVRIERDLNILKELIYSKDLLIFHSITMIMSLVEGDLITFYEIYESFDKLNIFNSNWENEMSQKLSDINTSISSLINSIQKMESNIINEIGNLSYITSNSFNQLNQSVVSELKNINSSINFNNLLSSIQTYQLHKIKNLTNNGSK